MTEHQHAEPHATPCVEIGPDVCLRPAFHGGNPEILDSETGKMAGGSKQHLAAFIVAHDLPDRDTRCEGTLTVDAHFGAPWTMTGTLEKGTLTIEPSYQCRSGPGATDCFLHGYVRDGAWVPA